MMLPPCTASREAVQWGVAFRHFKTTGQQPTTQKENSNMKTNKMQNQLSLSGTRIIYGSQWRPGHGRFTTPVKMGVEVIEKHGRYENVVVRQYPAVKIAA